MRHGRRLARSGRRVRPAGALLAGMLLGLILAGCGNAVTPTPPATQPASSSDLTLAVCPLVPDMDAIVGRAAAAPPSGFTIGSVSRCLWVYGSDPSLYVGVSVAPQSGHADGINAFGQGESIASFGDDARWWSTTQTLSVASGGRSFQVDMRLEPSAATRDVAVAIARRVLEHLP